MSDNQLGDYLRSRREQVTPDDVGLASYGVRRVAGLRREEVAMLAGISADYYLRLEQGRDRNPSVPVLEALARVLLLDETATAYLLDLAAPRPRSRPRRRRREQVPPEVGHLLDVIGLPAFVEGRYLDVLAANALATSLSPSVRVGENRLRSLFLDPAERTLFPGLPAAAPQLVAGFRARIGTDADDPRVVELVGELSVRSEEFRRAWARHDVREIRGRSVVLDHPVVGRLELRLAKLGVQGTDGQTLVVHHADPGSESAEKLALLASLTADPPSDANGPASQAAARDEVARPRVDP